MATPTSPSSAQTPSFKTNINRSKTKRWVEAKSYSYDGDDWGESDGEDFDEPSSQVPRGIPPRQAGGFGGPYPQPADRGRYGDLALQQGGPQSMRGASNPTGRQSPSRQSFDRGGDRRTYSLNSQSGFSEGPYPSGNRPPFAPPERFGPPRMGPPRSPRNQSPLRIDTGQRRPSMSNDPYPHAPLLPEGASGRPASPFRPDSRGGAYPDVRGGPYPDPRGPHPQPRPGPYGDPRGRPFAGPPPSAGRRSESSGRPPQAELMGRRESPNRGPYGPGPGPPPQMPGGFRSSLDTSREASPSRPFHPPRKSSLSQEQTPYDPSAATGGGPVNSDTSAGDAKPPPKSLPFIRPADIYRRMEEERERERRQSQESSRPSIELSAPKPRDSASSLRQRNSGEGLGRVPGRPTSETVEDDSSRRLKPMLEPVTERKSEYGFDNVLKDAPPDHPSSVPEPQTQSRSQPMSREPSEPPSASSTYTDRPDPISASTNRSKQSYRQLPEVGRVSDFGDNFFDHNQPPPISQSVNRSSDHEGFNRAVNQAFDESQNIVPPTPVSSMGDSIVRSTSANTSDVSPIISRKTSNAAGEIRTTVIQAEPTIAEESPELTPRRASSSTLKAPPPKSDRESKDLPELPRGAFRRNTESPSPSNSPARRPQSLEATNVPEAESTIVTAATPIDTSFDQAQIVHHPTSADHELKEREITPTSQPETQDFADSSIPRAESPTKGTVRGLTDRFEATSGRSSPSGSPERNVEPYRPSNTRLESFRPSLPGGWQSYTTNDGTSTPGQEQQGAFPREPTLAELRQHEAEKGLHESQSHPVHESNESNESTGAFAAAAAAGSALAGAFAAATGFSGDQESEGGTPKSEVPQIRSPEDTPESEFPTPSVEDHTDVTSHLQPSNLGPGMREATSAPSSAPPTPPPKDTPREESRQVSGDSSYFPSPLRAGRTYDGELETPARPRIVPSLSTDTSPQDDENDRLRKEIVKSLSPQALAFEPSRLQDSPSTLEAPPTSRSQVESSFLPKEYDSYWNEANPGEEQPQPLQDTAPVSEVSQPPPRQIEDPQPLAKQDQQDRPPLKKKFSWESSSTEQSPAAAIAPAVDSSWSARSGNWASPPPLPTHMEATDPDEALPPPRDLPQSEFASVSPLPLDEELQPPSVPVTQDPEETPSRETTPRPVEREIPAQTADMFEEQQSEPARQLDGEPKIRSFREILALKTPSDRIDAYNHARGQFASINTGLADWMQTVGENSPEHANMVANSGRLAPQEVEAILGHKVSPSRMKFPRLASLGTAIPQTSEDGERTESPLGGKMTKEQLLHSAGKFGGKAGGAAKGLFTKGKNKFRGSGGGDKAFLKIRRRSQPAETQPTVEPQQPIVVVTEPAPHSRQESQGSSETPANYGEPGSPVDDADTWSLSYAPTERHSSEKPRRSMSGPRELGSLAPPPYQSKNSPEKSSEDQPPVPPLPARLPSPHVSAHGSADGHETPSRDTSEVNTPSNVNEVGSTGGQETPSHDTSDINTPSNVFKERSPDPPSNVTEEWLPRPTSLDTSGPTASSALEPGAIQPLEAQEPEIRAEVPSVYGNRDRKFSWEDSEPPTSQDGPTDRHITESATVEEPISTEADDIALESDKPAPTSQIDVESTTENANDRNIPTSDTDETPQEPTAVKDESPNRHDLPSTISNPTSRSPSGVPADTARTSAYSGNSTDPGVLIAPQDEVVPSPPYETQPASLETRAEGVASIDDVPTKPGNEMSAPEPDTFQGVSRQFSFAEPGEHEIEKMPRTEVSELSEAAKKEAGISLGDGDGEKLKAKRPPSFSRPFGRPNIEEHPAFRSSPEPDRRSQVYATEEEQPVYYENPYARDTAQFQQAPQAEESYRIPGPYGQHFKLRQPVPPSSYRPPRQSDQPQQPYPVYHPPSSPERSIEMRPTTTEYSLPGIEPPAPPRPEDARRRSGILSSRTKPKTPVTEDDDSDIMDEYVVSERVKKRPGFLRKNRGVSDSHRAGSAASSTDNSRLGQLMTPSPVPSSSGKDSKKTKKLKRVSTSDIPLEEGGKRRSFSRLSGLFGRSSKDKTAPDAKSSPTHSAVLKKPEQPTAPPPDQAHHPNLPGGDFRGRPPPPGGYFASSPTTPKNPVGRDYPSHGDPMQSPYEQYALDKETGTARSQPSPYRPVQPPNQSIYQDRPHLPNVHIDTSGATRNGRDQRGSSHPHRPSDSYAGPNRPVRIPPYETNRGPHAPYGYHSNQVAQQGPSQHAIDLHKRSRSPRSGQTEYDGEQNGQSRSAAQTLGTFNEDIRVKNNAASVTDRRNQRDGQETPWRIDLPEDEARRQSGNSDDYTNRGPDSGVHLNSRAESEHRPSFAGNEDGPYQRRSSPYSASQHEQQEQHHSQDDEDEMYNDGGYGPPPRRSGHDKRHLRADESAVHGAVNSTSRSSSKYSQHPSVRGREQQPQQQRQALYELPGSRAPNHPESEDEDDIVMSPTSYPGQEWMPVVDFGGGEGLRGWDD